MSREGRTDVFRRAGDRVTLKQLAAHLGISTATVSNAFNRPDQLSPSRRLQILEAARALGYPGPDSRGRALRTGQSRIIGVMLSDKLTHSLSDSVANEFLSGLAQVFDTYDYRMLLLPVSQCRRDGTLFNSVADGYLIYGSLPDAATLEMLYHQHRPIVTVDIALPGLPAVGIDHESASQALAAHALASPTRECRPAIVALRMTLDAPAGRIARALPQANANAVAQARLRGFDRALSEVGYVPEEIPIWNVDSNSFDAAAPVIEQLLERGESNLLLCMSDRLALSVLTLAERRGLGIPQDLRLTGFDGIQEGQRRAPMLTTVYQNSRIKGAMAARTMLGLTDRYSILLPTWLIHGDTCP